MEAEAAARAELQVAAAGQWVTKNQEVIQSFLQIVTSGDVLWAAIKLQWTKGVVALETLW